MYKLKLELRVPYQQINKYQTTNTRDYESLPWRRKAQKFKEGFSEEVTLNHHEKDKQESVLLKKGKRGFQM